MAVDQQGLLVRLVRELVRLPGIGQKTAQRLAFHVLKADREDALRLAEAIRAVKDGLSFCRQCRNIAEGELCEFCLDSKRDQTRILVVEEPSTTYAIERGRSLSWPVSCATRRLISVGWCWPIRSQAKRVFAVGFQHMKCQSLRRFLTDTWKTD